MYQIRFHLKHRAPKRNLTFCTEVCNFCEARHYAHACVVSVGRIKVVGWQKGRRCSTEMATEESNAFVLEEIVPTSWGPKTSKITYGLLGRILKALDKYSRPQSKIVTFCAYPTKKSFCYIFEELYETIKCIYPFSLTIEF